MIASAHRSAHGIRPAGVLGALALSVLVLAGCAGPSPTAPPTSVASPESAPVRSTPASDAALPADVFAERDAFFAEQGFTGRAGPLAARTDTQRALVAAQRAWTEQHGGAWSDRSESVLLALSSDTCETGILSGHRIDAALLKKLIASSPVTAQAIPQGTPADQAALLERNIASMSVFGASYLCPADKDSWSRAFQAAYAS